MWQPMNAADCYVTLFVKQVISLRGQVDQEGVEKQDPTHEMFAFTNSSSFINSVNSECQIIIFIMVTAPPGVQTALGGLECQCKIVQVPEHSNGLQFCWSDVTPLRLGKQLNIQLAGYLQAFNYFRVKNLIVMLPDFLLEIMYNTKLFYLQIKDSSLGLIQPQSSEFETLQLPLWLSVGFKVSAVLYQKKQNPCAQSAPV